MNEKVYYLAKINRSEYGVWRVGVGKMVYDSWEEAEEAAKQYSLPECEIQIPSEDGTKRIYYGRRIMESNGGYEWKEVFE